MPNRSGAGRASTTGTPSTVTPVAWRSSRATSDTIWDRSAKASITGAGSAAGTTTARSNDVSAQRLGSPATSPPSAAAISSTSGRERLSVRPRAGRSTCACNRSRSLASVAGPTPGALRRRPSLAACRNSSTVSIPSAFAISTVRFGARPSIRPNPTSSGRTSRRSSSSSAIVPVSASSRSLPAIPGPMPRSSCARPCRASSRIGAGVPRIVSAARRYAREV